MKNVEKIVIRLIAEHLNLDPTTIGLDDRFGIEISIDSVDAISLIIACEETFGIAISEKEAAKFLTPRLAIRYIEALL
jgi:acyl carrier protein